MSTNDSNIIIDHGATKLSDLWKKEDYWAIWIGFVLLIVAISIFIKGAPVEYSQTIEKSNAIMEAEAAKAPFKTLAYVEAQEAKKGIRGTNIPISKSISSFIAGPSRWSDNLLGAFYVSQAEADAKNAANQDKREAATAEVNKTYALAKVADTAAAAVGYKDATLNKVAESTAADWVKAKSALGKIGKASPKNLFTSLPMLMVVFGVIFGIGVFFMGQNVPKFVIGFVGVFIVALVAMTLGNQALMRYYGLGVEPWAIVLGMIIANTVGTPGWMKSGLQVEFYIKTGLVLLGAEILFDKIVTIGVPGIFVAWVVTPIVLICTFIFGQKVLKIASPTLNIVISADMSVCGTSAAIATAAACRAKKEELTLALGLSLTFTAIMMVVMPMVIKAVGMPAVLGGAWIGGTIDATGAVAAAGSVLGSTGMFVAATIKMIQNVLIGVTAFGVAIYWCTSVDTTAGRTVTAMEIWNRFPKFVIGFLIASVIFSMYSTQLGPELSDALIKGGVIRGLESPLRTWFFVLAFTAIGLSTNFRELAHYFKGGKPLILYVVGQSFNLCLTLLMAYIMFYVVFPDFTSKI